MNTGIWVNYETVSVSKVKSHVQTSD